MVSVSLNHDSLGSSLLSNEKDSFLLLGNHVNQEICSDVVHIGDKDSSVFGNVVFGIAVLLDFVSPVLPLALFVDHVFIYRLVALHPWEVQPLLLLHEQLQLGPVVQLKEGPDAPHDGEQVEPLQVLCGAVAGSVRVLVLLACGYQAREQVDGLRMYTSVREDTVGVQKKVSILHTLPATE